MKAKTIVILALIIALFIIILVQNAHVVTVRLLFWEIGVSQIILLAVALFIGVILGFIAAKVMGGAQRKENRT
jgi:uncharacterized integral membrane protein